MENKLKDYENDLIEEDGIDMQEVKINVAFFMQHAIMGQQKALGQEEKNISFRQYVEYTEQLEILCKAKNLIPSDYGDKVEDYKTDLKAREKIDAKDIAYWMRLARFKTGLLYKEIFSNDTLTMALTT
jgi:hypothetical protein